MPCALRQIRFRQPNTQHSSSLGPPPQGPYLKRGVPTYGCGEHVISINLEASADCVLSHKMQTLHAGDHLSANALCHYKVPPLRT